MGRVMFAFSCKRGFRRMIIILFVACGIVGCASAPEADAGATATAVARSVAASVEAARPPTATANMPLTVEAMVQATMTQVQAEATPTPTASSTPMPSATSTNTVTPERYRGSGETIIYQCNKALGQEALCIMDGDGSISIDLGGVAGLNAFPSWSPDASRILFASYRDGRGDLYTMNSDGTDLRNLTHNGDWSADRDVWSLFEKASWSPDGAQIVFASIVNGIAGLYTMNADGSNVSPVIPSFTQSLCLTPDWAPDNTSVIAMCQTDDDLAIFELPLAGQNAKQVSPPGVQALFPSWSPDSRQIAFTGQSAGSTEDDGYSVYVINRDGTGLREIEKSASMPTWSPNGKKLAIEKDQRIYVIDIDGANLTPMVVSIDGGTKPDWNTVYFWDVAPAFIDAQPTATAQTRATATRAPSATRAATSTPRPLNPLPVCADSQACITYPRVGDVVTGIMPVLGSSNLPDLEYYKIEYRPSGEENWRWLVDGREQIANGKLMDWHTYTVPKGIYELKLTVIKRDGNYPEPCITRIRIY